MTKIDLDWTFDHIPSDDEVEAPTPPPTIDSTDDEAPSPQARRPRWRILLVFLMLFGLAGLGVFSFIQYSWWRLRSQFAQEIAYEDENSWARNADLVRSLQSKDDRAWLQRRGAEAALGLPGPLPADNLLPVHAPARVLKVSAPQPDLFEVVVLRLFADSAGATYAFEYTQRYRSAAPGQWERLPPDPEALRETTTWSGERLQATYPVADAPWLERALPEMDADLASACVEWQCPDELAVLLLVSGRPTDVPLPETILREADPLTGAYPIIFDLAPQSSRYPGRVTLASPHLTGFPHDEQAEQALTRATTVRLIAHLAERLSFNDRVSGDYFLDALIARAEIRLGLSSAPAPDVAPQDYVPPASLWHFRQRDYGALQPQFSMQALKFLDFVLAEHPPSADGRLLRTLRREDDLAKWLAQVLPETREAPAEAWAITVTDGFARRGPPPWARLNGLTYACEEGAWLVRDGRPQSLALGQEPIWLTRHAISGDGRFLAAGVYEGREWPTLKILDLTQSTVEVMADVGGWPLGWSADGQLVYLAAGESGSRDCGDFPCRLMLYDPAMRTVRRVTDEQVMPVWTMFWGAGSGWSADHTRLVLTVGEMPPPAQNPGLRPAVVSLESPLQVLSLDGEGFAPAISPDGTKIVYITGGHPWDFGAGAPPSIQLADLKAGKTTTLLAPEALAPPGQALYWLSAEWAPDGAALAIMAIGEGSGALFKFSLADGRLSKLTNTGAFFPSVPIGFSADARYLAAANGAFNEIAQIIIFDLAQGGEAFSASLGTGFQSAVWSPAGYLFAVAGPGGVYVTDLATGASHWISAGQSCSLAWFALP